MQIKFKKLYPGAIIPKYAIIGDAGMDLFSGEDAVIKPGERRLFKLGIAAEIPVGYVGLIWDKSGLAAKYGITCLGGVIDSSYRGEYGVILFNSGKDQFEVKKGSKIAQLLIQKIESVKIEEVEVLSETERNEGGFGSTGK